MDRSTEEKIRINLITPPDKLNNYHKTFTLVYPTNDTKSQFQNLVSNFDETINVYMYEQKDSDPELNWLIDVVGRSQYVILDIDNFPEKHVSIISYLLGFDKTFWLTRGENIVYNVLSKNRIYNLDWLYDNIGGKLET